MTMMQADTKYKLYQTICCKNTYTELVATALWDSNSQEGINYST